MTSTPTYSNDHAEWPNANVDLKYYMFDWDDNILHMPTKIHVEKKTDSGWQLVSLTTAQFAKVRTDEKNYRPVDGNWETAFSEFDDLGKRGDQAFLEDTKIALQPILQGQSKGAPSFYTFKQALIEGRLFAIITARSHSSTAIRKGVEHFMDHVLNPTEKETMIQNLKKYIEHFELGSKSLSDHDILKYYFKMNKYRGVTSPEFQKKMGITITGSESPEEAKQLAVKEFVDHVITLIKDKVNNIPISIGFSDDDPNNINAVEVFLRESLSRQFPDIKFVVYDTSGQEKNTPRKIVICHDQSATPKDPHQQQN